MTRSPWLVGGACLAWLVAASALASGPGHIAILWAMGIAALLVYLVCRLMTLPKPTPPVVRPDLTPISDPVSRQIGQEQADHETADRASPAVKAASTALRHDRAPLRVFNAEQVASVLGISVTVVVESMRTGEFPGNRLGDQWLCNEASLQRWLDGSWR